jgi:hypothetical protein
MIKDNNDEGKTWELPSPPPSVTANPPQQKNFKIGQYILGMSELMTRNHKD